MEEISIRFSEKNQNHDAIQATLSYLLNKTYVFWSEQSLFTNNIIWKQVHFTTSSIDPWDFVVIYGSFAKNPAKIICWFQF